MKRNIIIILFLVSICLFVFLLNYELSGEILAEEYGVCSNDISASKKNTRMLNKIFKRSSENSTIILPEGNIYISHKISLKHKSFLTIKGNNTRIINTSYSPQHIKDIKRYQNSNIFTINKCKNVAVSDLSFDYFNVVNASGKIVKYENNLTYFSVTSDKIKGGEFVSAVNIFDENGNRFSEKYLDETVITESVDVKNNIFAIKGFYGQSGQKICVRFTLGTYASPAIYVTETTGLMLKNINVYSCPSATFYAPCGNQDFEFDNFNIRSENTEDLFSSNEDGIHIKGLRGKLIIKNCNFEAMGDDILNVHSPAIKIADIKGKNIKGINPINNSPFDKKWAKTGDEIHFYDNNLNYIGNALIQKVHKNQIIFDKLPKGISNAYVMHNTAFCPETEVTNCSIKKGRARGLLIQTQNATIKNCTFEKLFLPAILVAPDITKWFEMGPSKNIIIDNNRFINCSDNVSSSVIHITDGHNTPLHDSINSDIHGNIKITNNYFENCKANAVNAKRYRNIKIENNSFSNSNTDIFLINPN